jgi:hypothetical protein
VKDQFSAIETLAPGTEINISLPQLLLGALHSRRVGTIDVMHH